LPGGRATDSPRLGVLGILFPFCHVDFAAVDGLVRFQSVGSATLVCIVEDEMRLARIKTVLVPFEGRQGLRWGDSETPAAIFLDPTV